MTPLMTPLRTPLRNTFCQLCQNCQKDPRLRLTFRKTVKTVRNKTPQPDTTTRHHNWTDSWPRWTQLDRFLTSLDPTGPYWTSHGTTGPYWTSHGTTGPGKLGKWRKSRKFPKITENDENHGNSRKSGKCLKNRETEVPDPYHGAPLVSAPPPVPTTPGTPTTRTPATGTPVTMHSTGLSGQTPFTRLHWVTV